jgi:hypothetical protein
MSLIKLLITCTLLSLLTACGGGSETSNNSPEPTPATNTTPEPTPVPNSAPNPIPEPTPAPNPTPELTPAPNPAPEPNISTGKIIDSPIANLSYETSSGQKGKTSITGEYSYEEGDTVSFKLGSIEFLSVQADTIITPFDLFDTKDITHQPLVNFLRLIQSLDDDGDISENITLAQEKIDVLNTINLSLTDLDVSDSEFSAITKLSLVSRLSAQAHFTQVLATSNDMDSDKDGIMNNEDLDNDNDGLNNNEDAFPWDILEQYDFDNDGQGDNSDTDDDNDGISDEDDSNTQLINVIGYQGQVRDDNITVIDELKLIALTNKGNNSLTLLDLVAGDELSVITFDYMPEKVVYSSQSQRIYVSLLHQEHSSYWRKEDQTGSIAVIDANTFEKIDELTLQIDPYDFVITNNEKIIVSPGSGQWGNVHAYDLSTGQLLASVSSVYQNSKLIYDKTIQIIYSLGGGSIRKFDVSRKSISEVSNAYYNLNYSNDYWLSPDGVNLITSSGAMYSTLDFQLVAELVDFSQNISQIVFDEVENIVNLVLLDGSVKVLNSTTYEVIDEISVIGNVLYSYSEKNYAYYLTEVDNELVVVKKNHPCFDCGNNVKPVASFVYSPINGDTSEEYTFDASESSDEIEDSQLKYRWDIDNDNTWDSHFISSSEFKHKFTIAGEKYVRLQVKDPGGLTHTLIKSFDVAQGVDNGINIPDTVPYILDFATTDTATDNINGYSYITDKQAKRLYIINLATGEAEKYFEFDYMPESLYLQKESKLLYIALLTNEHTSYSYDENQSGYISILDTEQQSIINTFKINTDPYDIVVTKSNKLIVSSGSGQWTKIYAYSAINGEDLGSASIRQRSKISLHPDEEWLFAANTDLSPSDVRKYDISVEGIQSLSDSPYHGDHRFSGNVWTTPGGNYIVTRGGDLFKASDMTYVTSLSDNGETFEDVIFDRENNLFFALTSNETIAYFNTLSYEKIAQLQDAKEVNRLALYDDKLYAFGENAQLLTWDHPCPICGDNVVPVSSFEVSPLDGDTSDTFIADASASTDTEDSLDALQFRWDFNNDNQWDTDYSSEVTAETKYILSGEKTIRLQVKDSLGGSHISEQTFNVSQGIDEGIEVTDSAAYQLDYNISDLVNDPEIGLQFIIDKNDKKLYILDLVTGETLKYFDFIYAPDSLYLQKDTGRLYVTLLKKEHNEYYYNEPASGFVAVFNVDNQTRINTVEVNTSPYDIVATSDGKLFISSGLNQGNFIVYDTDSSTQLVNQNISSKTALILSDNEQYLFTQQNNYPYIYKYSLSGSTISYLSNTSEYDYGNSKPTLWLSTDSKYLISLSGKVYLANDMSFIIDLGEDTGDFQDIIIDQTQNLLFNLTAEGDINYYNMTSFEKVGTVASSSSAQWLSMYNNELLVAASNELIIRYTHPCLTCGSNTAPVADFTSTPETPDTSETITFDASDTLDDEDLISQLQFKWDFDNDGEWDTSYSSSSSVEKKYIIAGTYTVVLQVKDSGGLIHKNVQQLTVTQGTDFGVEVTDSEAFTLDFAITDLAVDAENGLAYFSDKGAKRLYQINLATGKTERYFDFDFAPESIFFNAASKTLFIAHTVQEHSSYYWEEDQEGYISLLDATQKAITKTYKINTDPYDLVTTSQDKLIVTSGSGQWTDIFAYQASTGEQLGRSSIRQASKLAIHPNENYVYTANTDVSPSDIEKFDISGSAITSIGDSPYHGDYRMSGNIWVSPDGDYLITRGGDLFYSSDMTFVNNITTVGNSIEKIAFDVTNNKMYSIESDGMVKKYETGSFTLESSDDSLSNPSSLFFYNEQLYVISTSGFDVILNKLSL